MTRDLEQCGILTCVDSDEPVLSLGTPNDVLTVP